jgi:D-alanine--poly(phosphoribitol) ligase subunit 1
VDHLERFQAAASSHPGRPAVIDARRSTTYGELLSIARRIAFALVNEARHERVLIHLPQVAEAYAAMFGTGIAGAYYATTNVAAPSQRQRATVEAFKPDIIVTESSLMPEISSMHPSAKVVNIDRLSRSELSVRRPVSPLAYVMYTSGSTGRPKGVKISTVALAHYVDWIMKAMDVRPTDRWSQHPNIAFDLSVLDIYGTLCGGAALIPIAGVDLILPAKAIRRLELTIWNSVPSVMTSMVKSRQVSAKNFESLRLMTFCGEPLQKLHLDAVFAARPDLCVHNTYGPTEATVSCTLIRLIASNYVQACQSSVAIGEPIEDMKILLLGGESANVGEIVIAGPQLAEGYLDDPETTERHFRPIMLDGVETRAYFSGDWAELLGSNVYFRNRIDNQVKVRGERVELDDIAAAVMASTGRFACVLVVDDELHAVIEQDLPDVDGRALASALAMHLPPHLIPRCFHAIEELPRSPNGKIDLKVARDYVVARSSAAGANLSDPGRSKSPGGSNAA